MKTIIKLLLAGLFISCHKENKPIVSTPKMDYIPLTDTLFRPNKPILYDLNKDGMNDLLFHTEFFAGNPNDYTEFRVVPQINTAIATVAGVPKIFNKDEVVACENNNAFQWHEDPLVFCKRVYEIDLEKSYWDGTWKNAENKYLGIQVIKNNHTYIGWVRISVVKTRPG